MVDGTYKKSVDKDGVTSLEYQARSPEEMRYFDRLVKNAIGFDPERGDQVEVAGLPFALSSVIEPEADPMDKWRDMAHLVALPFIYLLIAILVLLFAVKPALKMLAAKPMGRGRFAAEGTGPGARVPGAEGVAEEDLTLSPKGLTDQERIYRLAQSDPDRAADLVRRWLRSDA
jgi:flagellar M-ring protein FliF